MGLWLSNSTRSQDYDLMAGSGQEDPKTCFAYNLAAAPLNNFLAISPDVSRYEVDGDSIEPVFSLIMISYYYRATKLTLSFRCLTVQVSGLMISLLKFEIMA